MTAFSAMRMLIRSLSSPTISRAPTPPSPPDAPACCTSSSSSWVCSSRSCGSSGPQVIRKNHAKGKEVEKEGKGEGKEKEDKKEDREKEDKEKEVQWRHAEDMRKLSRKIVSGKYSQDPFQVIEELQLQHTERTRIYGQSNRGGGGLGPFP